MERNLLFLTLLVTIISFARAQECGRCMPNEIACATANQFYLCEDGVINRDLIFNCPTNQWCTALGPFCMSDQEPLCPPSEDNYCGRCADMNGELQSFACVGPRQFRICENGVASNSFPFTCPPNTFCNMHAFETTGEICVPECVIEANRFPFTCLRPLPTPNDTPTPSSPPPSAAEMQQLCTDFESRANIDCFNVPNTYDADCSSYIRCTRKSEGIKTDFVKCPEGFYYSTENKCVADRPANCNIGN